MDLEGDSQSRTCPWLREIQLSWGSEAAWPRGSEPCPQWELRRQRSGRSSGPDSRPWALFPGLPSCPHGAVWTPCPPSHQPFSGPPAEPWPRHLSHLVGGDNVEVGSSTPQGEGAPDQRGWGGPKELGSEGLSRGDPCPQMGRKVDTKQEGPRAGKAGVQHTGALLPGSERPPGLLRAGANPRVGNRKRVDRKRVAGLRALRGASPAPSPGHSWLRRPPRLAFSSVSLPSPP